MVAVRTAALVVQIDVIVFVIVIEVIITLVIEYKACRRTTVTVSDALMQSHARARDMHNIRGTREQTSVKW